jgi:hypothetical protein
VISGADPLIVDNASNVILQDKHILGKSLHPQQQHSVLRNDKSE